MCKAHQTDGTPKGIENIGALRAFTALIEPASEGHRRLVPDPIAGIGWSDAQTGTFLGSWV